MTILSFCLSTALAPKIVVNIETTRYIYHKLLNDFIDTHVLLKNKWFLLINIPNPRNTKDNIRFAVMRHRLFQCTHKTWSWIWHCILSNMRSFFCELQLVTYFEFTELQGCGQDRPNSWNLRPNVINRDQDLAKPQSKSHKAGLREAKPKNITGSHYIQLLATNASLFIIDGAYRVLEILVS